jgi:hypothetical protein
LKKLFRQLQVERLRRLSVPWGSPRTWIRLRRRFAFVPRSRPKVLHHGSDVFRKKLAVDIGLQGLVRQTPILCLQPNRGLGAVVFDVAPIAPHEQNAVDPQRKSMREWGSEGFQVHQAPGLFHPVAGFISLTEDRPEV